MTRYAILRLVLLAAALTFSPSLVFGQNASCSLGGTVYDASNAVVPNAKVMLRNEATNTTRETVSNDSGFFSISAFQPGTYAVAVSAPGFAAWERARIVFSQGESRNLPNIVLRIKAAAEKVQVSASLDSMTPLDTGETRQTLTSQMLADLPIQGRNVSELIKILPGMAMNSGLSQYAWNGLLTKSNSGPAGQYVANGTQPYGSMTVTSDGANLLDPGNQGTQVANINPSQTAEVTVLTSAYGAEYAKGPVTVQAIGKSGVAAFHGSVYIYATDFNLDSEDAYWKALGFPKSQSIPSYMFPGGEIGGPVLIPGSRFNRKRDKLFFYIAPEGMDQPAGVETVTFLPTAQMLQGNFSPAYLATLGAGFSNAYPGYAAAPAGHGAAADYPGGMIPQSMLDSTSLAYARTFPQASWAQPNATGNNFYDYRSARANRFEFRVRTDYNIGDKNRLSVTWNRQDEFDRNPIGIWYYPGSALPYPSTMPSHLVSNVLSGNLVHIFGPTLTNETVFAAAQFINPVRLRDPSAVNPITLGLGGYRPLVPDKYVPQPPNVAGVPGYYAPAFGTGFHDGEYGKMSRDPSLADNLSKVAGAHALKFGVYWDFAQNDQPGGSGGNAPQGLVIFANTGADSSGNTMADFFTGRVQSFRQPSAINVEDLKQSQYSLYAQDQWKIARKLTITYGVRLDHIGQWYPTGGPGLAVWNPASYNNSSSAGAWTGVLWHGIDKSVPVSGFPSKLFFPLPRFGLAWDVFGHGKTVLRGGFGVYRYQLSFNSVTNAGIYDEPTGVANYTLTDPANLGWNFAQYGLPSGAAGLGGNLGVLQQGDARTPYTESYDLIVSQALPWKSILEIEYSGSRSRDLLITGNGTNTAYIGNLNKTPPGAYFLPDPITGAINDPASVAIPFEDYRPYQNYQTMMLVRHGSYQNYNALMASWNKKAGPVTLLVNYTFGKVLGIRDGESDNGATNGYAADPFNLRANYGVLPYDHTGIFNAAYVVHLPLRIHGNRFLRAAANGWVLSGTIMRQSGAPIQPNTSGNMYLSTTGGLNAQMWLGTDSERIRPILTCDPRSNLKSGQYFNPACFALGPQGTNGPVVWPYIKGPAYFNSDLAMQKQFRVAEHTFQFRISAFNFLNHPIHEFTWTDVELNFAAPVAGTRNSNALTTGYPIYSVGSRVVGLAIVYNF